MRKITLALAGSAIVAGLALAFSGTAHATDSKGPSYLESKCANVSTWYVNGDETDRKPDATEDGLVFSSTDLIHHAANLDVSDLVHGRFNASPSPDQPSFFSVEVINTDGSGYGTLRWNTNIGQWEMSTHGDYFADASAVAVVNHFSKSHHVFSFGVGYTEHPAGTVTTTVSSVTFQKHHFSLLCKPVVSSSSASPSPSASSASASASPSVSHSASHSPAAGGGAGSSSGGALAVTGPNGWAIGGTAAFLIVAGVSLVALARRRKAKFVA